MESDHFPFVLVIPIRDALEDARRAVACAHAEPGDRAVLLIDDASRPETAAFILSQPDGTYVVRNDEPRGYAHALNTAALLALRLGYPAVLAVNSDTVWTEGGGGRLVAEMMGSGFPFAGPALSRAGSGQFGDAGVCDTKGNLELLKALEVWRVRPTIYGERPIADVNGAFFAFTAQGWVEQGPFDERFGLGAAEEIDWMRRFPEGGIYVPSICVWHAKHASYKDHPEIDAKKQWAENNAEWKRKTAAGERVAWMTYPRAQVGRIAKEREKD